MCHQADNSALNNDIREHDLKIWPEFFEPVCEGIKRFEVRKNDRGIKVGDYLKLREWDPIAKDYSGREVRVKVLYMLDWRDIPGYSIMSIEVQMLSRCHPRDTPSCHPRDKNELAKATCHPPLSPPRVSRGELAAVDA